MTLDPSGLPLRGPGLCWLIKVGYTVKAKTSGRFNSMKRFQEKKHLEVSTDCFAADTSLTTHNQGTPIITRSSRDGRITLSEKRLGKYSIIIIIILKEKILNGHYV